MKTLLIALALTSTTSVIAQKIKYENLPAVKMLVTSVDLASQVDGKHEQRQKEALEELKRHVEINLNRQYIDSKCTTPVKETFNNPGFAQRSSTCSVSFL